MRILLIAATLTLCANLAGTAQTSSRNTLIERGVALHDEGKYTEALRVYAEAREGDTLNEDVNHEIATTYSALEKHEEAIYYANLVLRHGRRNRARAAVVKGNALDHLGRTKEAIQVYKDAIATETDAAYMLRYNLALTYYNADIRDDARDQLMAGLTDNPGHASSHLLLGVIMAERGERIPAVLALSHFLMLEADSRRASGALSLLDKQLGKGVTQESDNKINITVASGDEKSPFTSMDMMMALMAASAYTEDKKTKTPQELFKSNMGILFGMLGSLEKEKSAAFWWKTYGKLFSSLEKAGHTETFSYYVRQGTEKPEVIAWLEKNPQKIEAFSEWYEKERPRKKK